MTPSERFRAWNEQRERGRFWSGKSHPHNSYPGISALLDAFEADDDEKNVSPPVEIGASNDK